MARESCLSESAVSSFVFVAVCYAGLVFGWGCGTSEVKPVDLYPEDMCAFCRMAISDHRCAGEILTETGDALKFDDIGCLERFMEGSKDLKAAAVFVKNYETKEWLRRESAVVIRADVATPMGSGKIAFSDSAAARRWIDSVSAFKQGETQSASDKRGKRWMSAP